MSAGPITLLPLLDIALIEPGADLAGIMAEALIGNDARPLDHDVLVIAQKIVSKAERRYVYLETQKPSPEAVDLAEKTDKDPRLVEIILAQSNRVIAHRPGLVIVEHKLGLIMANAGIDRSNIEQEQDRTRVLLLPKDPDRSAKNIRNTLNEQFGVKIGVIISDSFGRPWRNGVVGTAIGASGLPALLDLTGRPDLFGRPLEATEQGFADELAAAASLLMGQADEAIPAVLIRGVEWSAAEMPAAGLIRPRELDLFR